MNTTFERTDSKEDWCTPKYIVDELGSFDLDPCQSHYNKNQFAPNQFFIEDDALSKEWFGRVWCNPPYGNKAEKFIRKLADHGNGVALIFARVDTKLWHEVIFKKATAIFIFKGRIKFVDTEGGAKNPAGAPSALIAFGEENAKALYNTTFRGEFIKTDHM